MKDTDPLFHRKLPTPFLQGEKPRLEFSSENFRPYNSTSPSPMWLFVAFVTGSSAGFVFWIISKMVANSGFFFGG